MLARATGWWRAHQGERRFRVDPRFRPHSPYLPPEPLRARYASQPYYGEIAAVDAELGPFLQGFLDGKEESTLIAITGDHGESLGEHGEQAHSLFTYESTLHVPLLFWRPGIKAERDPWPARHVDIVPTVLAALGVAKPAGLPGLPLLAPRAEGSEQIASYFEALTAHLNQGLGAAARHPQGPQEIHRAGGRRALRPRDRSQEEKNLIDDQRRLARALAEALPAESKWPPGRGALSEGDLRAAQPRLPDGRQRSSARATAPAEDLRQLTGIQSKMQEVVVLFHAGELDRAMALCREVMAQRPDMEMAWLYLANSLIRAGRGEEALGVLREAVARKIEASTSGGSSAFPSSIPKDGRRNENPRKAGRRSARRGRPQQPGARRNPNGARRPRLRPPRKSEDAEPDNAGTYENLAFAYLQVGKLAEAETAARKAIELEPKRTGAFNNLALALYHQGRAKEAVATWQEPGRLDPSNADTLFNLGSVALEIGEAHNRRSSPPPLPRNRPAKRLRSPTKRRPQMLASLPGRR